MTAETADTAAIPAKAGPSLGLLRLAEAVSIPVGALVVSAVLFALFLLAIGKDPLQFYQLIWAGGFGSSF